MIATLARLHSFDPAALGLGDYGPPGNYFERQVGRWTKQYRAAETERIEEAERLIEFLPRTVPAQERVSDHPRRLSHRQSHLCIRRPGSVGGARLGIVDARRSTADFTYLVMQWEMPAEAGSAGLRGVDFAKPASQPGGGCPPVLRRHRPLRAMPALDWYFAYNLFRLLGIVQGIKKRFLDGNASSAKAEEMASRVPMLAQAAWHFAARRRLIAPTDLLPQPR
jgi:aminoglycoside phosphotransferase (APT) family kinase protein